MEENLEIVVQYVLEKDDVHRLIFDAPGLPDIVIDYTNVPPEQRAGNAQRLLCASALYCFASTLASALESRGVRADSITGKATARKGRDEYYRTRITDIRIDVYVDTGKVGEAVLERCRKIMERGCLVTYSLSEGIEVEHQIHSVTGAEPAVRDGDHSGRSE